MLYGNFVIQGFNNNECFDPNARDNCCAPFIALRNALKNEDIEINTSDLNKNKKVSFEIHIDKQKEELSNIPTFLFLWETSNVRPRNAGVDKKSFIKIFTWDDSLVMNEKYSKFYLPITEQVKLVNKSFKDRVGFCCALSSNKAPEIRHEKDLYSERIKIYKWFEKNASNDFDLYGSGWDKPLKEGIYQNQLILKIFTKLGIKKNNFLKIYKGFARSKLDVLKNYKYSICYENVYGLDGYVTEKIFDSMLAGYIPIYWGAKNISSYVPKKCFIDRREFNNNRELYDFLKSIDQQDYEKYQNSIKNFFDIGGFEKYSSKYFAKQISTDIIDHLKTVS